MHLCFYPYQYQKKENRIWQIAWNNFKREKNFSEMKDGFVQSARRQKILKEL